MYFYLDEGVRSFGSRDCIQGFFFSLYLSNLKIQFTDTVKILGLIFDKKLSWPSPTPKNLERVLRKKT